MQNDLDKLEVNRDRQTYYRFLYHLVSKFQPLVSLEIGVESGMASLFMARAAAKYGGHVVGIDINHCQVDAPNYHFIHGDSTKSEIFRKVLEVVRDFGPIGLVYQDSSHHYIASCREWSLYSQLLDFSAIWICDDITPAFHDPLIDPPGLGMVQYFETLPGDKRLYQDVLHFGNRQGIVLPEVVRVE